MKTIIGAVALVIAAPIAAQTAPANPLAGHSQHQQQGHGQMRHGQSGQHQGQQGCCKQVNGRMECQMMMMMGHGGQQSGQAQHQGHSGQ